MEIWVVSTLFAIMNNAAVNIYAQVFMWTYILIFIAYTSMEWNCCIVTLCLTFRITAKLFSKVAAPFYIPTSNAWGFQFFYNLTNICYYLFYYNHPSYEMISACGFDLHFPDG